MLSLYFTLTNSIVVSFDSFLKWASFHFTESKCPADTAFIYFTDLQIAKTIWDILKLQAYSRVSLAFSAVLVSHLLQFIFQFVVIAFSDPIWLNTIVAFEAGPKHFSFMDAF